MGEFCPNIPMVGINSKFEAIFLVAVGFSQRNRDDEE